MGQVSRRDPLTGIELTGLIAEFDRIECDIARLSDIIGGAYGSDWCGRGLRLAQLLRLLKVRIEDHGYDRLSSQDRAAFQPAQRGASPTPTLSALQATITARKNIQLMRSVLAEPDLRSAIEEPQAVPSSIVATDDKGGNLHDQSTELRNGAATPAQTCRLTATEIRRGTTQFAALPCRIGEDGSVEVMLLTSRETHRWVIPKGWPIKGRKPAKVAEQEAYEEAGLRGHVIGKRPLGSFHYEKRLSTGPVLCKVQVYLFHVEEQESDWPEQHERVTRWFHPAEAAGYVEERGLEEILRRLHNSSILAVGTRPGAGRAVNPERKGRARQVDGLHRA